MSDAPGEQPRTVLSAGALAAVRPDAPPATRLRAARGEAGLPPADRLAAMAVLASDADPAVRQAARERLSKGPVSPLLEGVTPETDARILDILARARAGDPAVADRLLRHPSVPDAALDRLAAAAPGRLAAAVQDLALPRRHRTRIAQAMQRAVVNDAGRSAGGVNRQGPAGAPSASLSGPAGAPSGSLSGPFEAQAPTQGASGGAPAEPRRPPATQDPPASPAAQNPDASPAADDPASLAAADALEAELDEYEFGPLLTEEIDERLPDVAEKRENLYRQILEMTVSQKIQLAFKGNKEARGILVKDPNKLVSGAVMKSPRLTETEVVSYAHSRSVSADVFRAIVRNKDYAKLYPIRLALASNPRAPVDIALHCLNSLHESDIASLAKNRNVSSTVQTAAKRVVQQKAEKERQKQQQLFGGGH